MIVAIMQPTFLPWIGYFDLIDRVDRFVFFDDAQVLKRSWAVRNRILTQNGESFLTVPLVGHSQNENCSFVNTQIDPAPKWRRTHLASIRHAYAKAPFFQPVFEMVEDWINAEHSTIGSLNMSLIRTIAERIGIDTQFVQSSDLKGVTGAKDARLLSVCRSVGASTYLAAQGSAAYIETDRPGGAFSDSDIALFYHNFDHPIYPQQSDGFTSHMCIIDLLMNCGFASALDIIRSGRREWLTGNELKDIAA